MKMGVHNRITAERFHEIKGALAVGTSDDEVMRKFQIRKTTLRYIKLSQSFYEYRLRTEKCVKTGKPIIVYAPTSGIAFEDYRPRRKNKTHGSYKQVSGYKATECGLWGVIILSLTGIVIMFGLIVILLSNLVF